MIRIITVLFLFLVSQFTDAQPQTTDSATAEGITITVKIPNLTSDKGVVRIALYDKANFMMQPLDGKISKIKDKSTEVQFENVKPGEYAIISYHDGNNNDKFDMDEQNMPLEDWGMSNNPPHMEPPTFDAAKFTVTDENMEITIKY
ncbi:MAG: hypothetical protein CSA39_07025 [Flavobacteriales bacterium]|nr:MAG: hypothetical protein CSA39_07025 [Flavobacteriales bacterium]